MCGKVTPSPRALQRTFARARAGGRAGGGTGWDFNADYGNAIADEHRYRWPRLFGKADRWPFVAYQIRAGGFMDSAAGVRFRQKIVQILLFLCPRRPAELQVP